MSIQPDGGFTGGTGAEEGIEHHVTRVAAGRQNAIK